MLCLWKAQIAAAVTVKLIRHFQCQRRPPASHSGRPFFPLSLAHGTGYTMAALNGLSERDQLVVQLAASLEDSSDLIFSAPLPVASGIILLNLTFGQLSLALLCLHRSWRVPFF